MVNSKGYILKFMLRSRNIATTDITYEMMGRIPFHHATWEEFYQQATAATEIALVKTHSPPQDNQPVIYIVRDGRLVIQSYKIFHDNLTINYETSLLKLIIGSDEYGDWSSHFYQWNRDHEAKRLLVRYEQLVNPTKELLQSIAHFLSFRGEVKSFVNPFNEHHKIRPTFFREGKTDFQPISEWTPFINHLFYQFHGQLMTELGYPDNTMPLTRTSQEQAAEDELLTLIGELFLKNRELEQQIQEKEAWIVKNNQFTQNVLEELRNRGISINQRWS